MTCHEARESLSALLDAAPTALRAGLTSLLDEQPEQTPERGSGPLRRRVFTVEIAGAEVDADAVFAIQPHLESAKALYDDIKRGVVAAGRPPQACKMLFGVQPIIGASRAEAVDKQAEHNALVPLEGGLAILSGHLDFDLSTLPLDTVMAYRTEPKLQRMQTRYRSMTGELLTLYSLVNSVVENVPGARSLVVLWNGRQPRSFAGHVDTSRPLLPSPELASS